MKILFVGHEASRTGASLMLLYLLEWLKKNKAPDVELSLLLIEKGELFAQFSELVDDTYSIDYSRGNSIFKKLRLKSQSSNANNLLRKLAAKNFDVIFANTIISIPIACRLKKLSESSKMVVYVHELQNQISISLPNLPEYFSEINGFIAVSNLVKTTITQNYFIDLEKVQVIYGFTKLMHAKFVKRKASFVVLGIGKVGWPKRCDLFIQVAYYIKNRYPEKEIKFKWVGAIDKNERILLNDDLLKAGLKNNVEFCGQRNDLEDVISNSQVLLMTSREESLGLVAIESGMLRKPVICFEKVSGFSEIIGKGSVQVPYLDVEGMAKGIVNYYDNPDQLVEDGKLAYDVCIKYTPEIQAEKIYHYILNAK